jgi:hypothetical protein
MTPVVIRLTVREGFPDHGDPRCRSMARPIAAFGATRPARCSRSSTSSSATSRRPNPLRSLDRRWRVASCLARTGAHPPPLSRRSRQGRRTLPPPGRSTRDVATVEASGCGPGDRRRPRLAVGPGLLDPRTAAAAILLARLDDRAMALAVIEAAGTLPVAMARDSAPRDGLKARRVDRCHCLPARSTWTGRLRRGDVLPCRSRPMPISMDLIAEPPDLEQLDER